MFLFTVLVIVISHINLSLIFFYTHTHTHTHTYTHIYIYTGVDKIRFTVVRMEKDMQLMIIAIASLNQKNVAMAQCT